MTLEGEISSKYEEARKREQELTKGLAIEDVKAWLEKMPKRGLWTLCQDRTQLYDTFLKFAKRHDADPIDIEPLRKILRSQVLETGLVI